MLITQDNLYSYVHLLVSLPSLVSQCTPRINQNLSKKCRFNVGCLMCSGLLRRITGKKLSMFRRTCVLSILWVCQSKKSQETPNMDSVGPSQTSVSTRHLTRQNIAEDLRLHLCCYENFKPRTCTVVFQTIILNIPQNYSNSYQDICIELSLHDSVRQYN